MTRLGFIDLIKLRVATYLAMLFILAVPLLAFAQAVETTAQTAPPGTQIAFYVIAAAFGVFSVLAAFGARWVNANVSNTMLKSILLRVDDVIFTVVKEINQTVVDASRDADGKLKPDAAEAAKAAALAKVKSYLGVDGLKLLMKIVGFGTDPDTYLLSKIEAAVHDVKALKASASVP